MRFHPHVQELRRWLDAGELGDVQHLHAELGWRKEPERVERPELGRGAALDFGVYPLSLAHFLLGETDDLDVEVERHASGVDETMSLQLRYARCTATLRASITKPLSNDALVTGSQRSAHLHKPLLAPRGLTLLAPGGAHSLWWRASSLVGPWLSGALRPQRVGLRREAEELMRCVRMGRTTSEVVPPSATLWALRCVDRVRAD